MTLFVEHALLAFGLLVIVGFLFSFEIAQSSARLPSSRLSLGEGIA